MVVGFQGVMTRKTPFREYAMFFPTCPWVFSHALIQLSPRGHSIQSSDLKNDKETVKAKELNFYPRCSMNVAIFT